MEMDPKQDNINVDPCPSSTAISTKLGLCEVCAFDDAKYTCPKCEVKTCSLKCIRIHKLELECDGQRDRVKFIPGPCSKRFTYLDRSSDYSQLAEITRNVEACRKNICRKHVDLPGHLQKLRDATKSRNITLKFMPYQFVRHRSNKTRLNFKTNIIYWHIEWILANANNLKLSNFRVSENTKLSSVFSQYLVEQNDTCLQKSLLYYQAAGISGIKFFLKAEQKRGKKFYELDPTLPLRECLEKKIIIEYPIIYVILKDYAHEYDVIDSDDEENGDGQDQVKLGNEVITRIISRAESNMSLYKSRKNLLFASENSGEELSSDEN